MEFQNLHLLIREEGQTRACKRKWQSGKQIGLTFEADETIKEQISLQPERRSGDQIMRGQMLALRAALDKIEVGILLLDSNMRAQFINRAFRRMWVLPDALPTEPGVRCADVSRPRYERLSNYRN